MIKDLFLRPYPQFVKKWRLTILTSVFVSLFIIALLPFGLFQNLPNKILVASGYGLVTFIDLYFNMFIIMNVFKKWFRNWTVIKHLIWLLWVLSTIGLANFLYSVSIFSEISFFRGFLTYQFYTVVVGFFPIAILTLINSIRALSHQLNKVNDVSSSSQIPLQDEKITIVSDNYNENIILNLSQFYYLKSEGNYLQVNYTKQEKEIKSLIRGTIKLNEQQSNDVISVIRCHRAYIVNMDQVLTLKGNSQNMKIVMKKFDAEIPVSRNLSKKVKELFHSRS